MLGIFEHWLGRIGNNPLTTAAESFDNEALSRFFNKKIKYLTIGVSDKRQIWEGGGGGRGGALWKTHPKCQ